MTGTGRFASASKIAVVVAAFWAVFMASDALAKTCRIPAALLCPGCAHAIKITILPQGHCRVSFETPRPGSADAAATTRDIEIEVQHPGFGRRVAHRPLDQRLRAARRLRRTQFARGAAPAPLPGPRCFEFNGRRYCE